MKNITKFVKSSYSYSEVARKLGFESINGSILRKIQNATKELDTSHFRKNGRRTLPKYEVIEKLCPVCKKKFQNKDGGNTAKTTCSHACANTYFRVGPNHGNWKEKSYRTTCFHYHKKKCIICGELKIVEVHHYDGDNKNNAPENLMPLCPTHHQYVHSSFRNEVEEKIERYRKRWISRNDRQGND